VYGCMHVYVYDGCMCVWMHVYVYGCVLGVRNFFEKIFWVRVRE